MPIDEYCLICDGLAVVAVRYPGGEIEHGLCGKCVQDPRHKPLPECETFPIARAALAEEPRG